MSEGGSLINLGNLSKPATVLIEKVSEAVGGISRPWQIRRVAKAEAEAEKITAVAQIEITELQQRALVRMIQEEGKRQENIENITAKAIPDLRADAKPEELDADWLAHFFDKCRLVSEMEMQSLWAKLLAEEANSPKSISRQTVELVSTLEKADAHLFTTLCGFGWVVGRTTPLVFDVDDDIYTSRGISFSGLTHLDSLGLISFDNIGGFVRQHLPKRFAVYYYGREVLLELPKDDDNKIPIGKTILSRAGHELAPLCGSQPVPELVEYVMKRWNNGQMKAVLGPEPSIRRDDNI